jgi:peptidyl-prolyl cis-trans isomerase SurA
LEKPGQYSDPFQTQYGWHIVRLERKIPLGTFEELASSLKTRISRDERTQISRQALQARLRKDFGLKENPAVKSRILELNDSSLAKGAWKKTLDTRTQRSLLFELNGKKFSVEDFLAQRDRSAHTVTSSKDALRSDYEQFIDETILKMQEEVVAREHPEYRFLLNEYYEGILLFEIMEKEVWNKASEDSVGQRRYYEANASNYTAGPRVKATLYAASDKNLLMPLKDLLDDPSPGKLQEYVAKNKVRAESGFFGREDKAVLQKVPWEPGVHSAENNGMYYLAWLKDILQAGQMSFEEARPALISDYQNQLEQRWLEALRKKFVVKINQKGHAVMLNKLEKRRS